MALINYSNEYGKLKRVALYRPRVEEIFQGNPEEVMYVSLPDASRVLQEFDRIVRAFQVLGIEVLVLHDDAGNLPNCTNMIYLRDVASVINKKIIPANMKYPIRASEPDKFQKLLLKINPEYADHMLPVLDDEKMEGADILVLSENKICAYTGYRTEPDAIDKIARVENLDILDMPANIQHIPQHLLGGMHILDRDLLVRRSQYCSTDIKGYKSIDLIETDEITKGFGMNIVTIAPREILMPKNCAAMQTELEKFGIICHLVEINEIHKMGGGLACMTLPLERESV